MKKLFLLFLLVLGWQDATFAGVKAVFPYNYPSKNTLKSLVMENSSKGKAYGDYLLYAVNLGLSDTTLTINRANIDILFNNLFSEEFTLLESDYMNSGYDSISHKMMPSVGHRWKGFVWFFRIGTYSIPLIKTDCGNVLIVKAIRTKVLVPNISPVINPVQVTQPRQSYSSPRAERTLSPRVNYVQRRIEPIVVKNNSNKKELRIWKIVIPVGAMLAGTVYFLSKTATHQSYRQERYNNSGGGQDPPANNDDGGPIDPPPSGN